ncbi:MAG: hypothetical protein GQ527_13060 [Bacteroidales bacterium]|nr:hypothetical protein [Bacteroidales bacterium]
MKNMISLLILSFIGTHLYAQTINEVMIDPDLDMEILIGEVDEIGLANPVFVENWNESYGIYLPDKVTLRKLKKVFRKNKDLSIQVFLASWCGDSQQHLPDFVKLAHGAKIKNIHYYALNRQKEMEAFDFIDLYSFEIERVPTFIIYDGDKEIGRIIETPEVSLEKDLLKIVSQ